VDGEAVSRVVAALIAKCPEWAAGVMATAVTIWAGVQSVRGIITAMRGLTGPTDSQVNAGLRQVINEAINGKLVGLSDKLDRLDAKFDARIDQVEQVQEKRHAENQRLFGSFEGALGVRRRQ